MEPSRLAIVRAVLITLVITWQVVEAAPIPHVVNREHLRSPVGREQLGWWSEHLTAIGVPVSPEELGHHVQTATQTLGGAHKKLLEPLDPVEHWFGMGQGWALFADPDTHPARLSIRVRREATWDLVFENLDPEHAWFDPVLRFRRVRGCYDAGSYRSKPTGPYKRFATWVSHELFAVDPTIDEVEVRTLRTHTTVPGAPPDLGVEIRNVIRTKRPAP